MELHDIAEQMQQAFSEYLTTSEFRPGQIIVIGCSTSEVHGGQIGKDSQPMIAETLYEVLAPMAEENKLYLDHLQYLYIIFIQL